MITVIEIDGNMIETKHPEIVWKIDAYNMLFKLKEKKERKNYRIIIKTLTNSYLINPLENYSIN